MPRKPINEAPLTKAERQRRYREKKKLQREKSWQQKHAELEMRYKRLEAHHAHMESSYKSIIENMADAHYATKRELEAVKAERDALLHKPAAKVIPFTR